MNGNFPLYYQALMVSDYVDGSIKGKLIGRMKDDYIGIKKQDLIYIAYRKELFNYLVSVFKFDEFYGELTPIELKTFKDVNELIDYVRSIQSHVSEEVYLLETIYRQSN